MSSGGTVSGSGGVTATGGQLGAGGASSGGAASGGASSGGAASGGASSGGAASGGASSGGAAGTGGASTGGASGGGAGSGGGGTGGGGAVTLDCNAAMPTSGAVLHENNGTGGQGNLAWEIWSTNGTGQLTSYSVPAFTASWPKDGGYLGRLGFEWGGFQSSPKPYEQHGTITAQIVSRKDPTATADIYSYIGMYGWSTDPCVEWYVVEDSFNPMPINPGTTTKMGEVPIDDGTYIMYTRPTEGNGGSRCSGLNSWIQYYSVRKTARQCGVVSLTQHFDAWKDLQMPLGNLLEAKVLVEVGGGPGKVDLPIANVMETP